MIGTLLESISMVNTRPWPGNDEEGPEQEQSLGESRLRPSVQHFRP